MQNCDVCLKKNLWQSTQWIDGISGARWWKCRNCGNEQIEEHPQGLKTPPKILYLDIETALMRVSIYDLYSKRNQSISKDAIERHRFVINWAAAWVDPQTYKIKGGIISGVTKQSEVKREDDRRILKPLFSLMDEADYWCGHNSQNFDIKILKYRFFEHGWGYPAEAKQVDTFKLSGRGKPESRGLDYLLQRRGYAGKKHELTPEEWREIVRYGTPKLLDKADKYCRQDVRGGVDLLREYTKAEEQSGRIIFR